MLPYPACSIQAMAFIRESWVQFQYRIDSKVDEPEPIENGTKWIIPIKQALFGRNRSVTDSASQISSYKDITLRPEAAVQCAPSGRCDSRLHGDRGGCPCV